MEVCEIGDTLSWSAVPFFVRHSSCSLEVRGCQLGCNTLTSRDFVPSLHALYDICEKDETSHTSMDSNKADRCVGAPQCLEAYIRRHPGEAYITLFYMSE